MYKFKTPVLSLSSWHENAGAYRNIASFAYGHLYKKLASVQEKILKKYSLFLIN